MKLFDFYSWATGSMSEFANRFQDTPALQQKAKIFWRGMESNSLFFFLIFIVIGILVAETYYKDFSNKTGRKYHPKYWALFGGIALILTFFITFIFESFMLNDDISGAQSIEWIIASVNTLYAAIIYFFTSVFCCRFQTTSAYRLF